MNSEAAKLTGIRFENFTAFDELEIDLSPGINVFIGENGTGKTHILKAAYAACDITKNNVNFADKITNVFYPSGKDLDRLVKKSCGSNGKRQEVSIGGVEVAKGTGNGGRVVISLFMRCNTTGLKDVKTFGLTKWMQSPADAVYIPVKDMMANAPGFLSLYSRRHIHFEEVYADILNGAYLPELREDSLDEKRKNLLGSLEKAMGGTVIYKQEEFFLLNKYGELEFTLLAEGLRKLGLLWLLVRNGILKDGSVLLWDEPETNLNPMLMRLVVEVLVELQRMGVQIIVTTHDYVILKEFDLLTSDNDNVCYHNLFRNEDSGEIEIFSTEDYMEFTPHSIDDAFSRLVDREIRRYIR